MLKSCKIHRIAPLIHKSLRYDDPKSICDTMNRQSWAMDMCGHRHNKKILDRIFKHSNAFAAQQFSQSTTKTKGRPPAQRCSI